MTQSLEQRVSVEFREMPGLRVTIPQVSRLLDVDTETCTQVLNRMVETGFLRRVGPYYFRADYGRLSA